MSVTKTTISSNVVAQSPRSSTVASPNSESECLYDVFLSFRVLDTRKKFADHLYHALKQEVQTFRDENEIERGEVITSELRKAIYSSRMSVIVLSKNYANSRPCLRELRTILDCREENSDHIVLPVFYEVDPSEIKKQAENLNFGRPRGLAIFRKLLACITTFSLSILARREEESVTVEEVKGWAVALEEVSNIAGMVSQSQCDGYEATFIKEIVAKVKSKLSGKHLRVADDLASEGVMEKEYMLLQEISEQTYRWRIKVKVVNIWGPFPSKDEKTEYKRFVLRDEKGKKIHAIMYGEVIQKFNDTLELHKTYIISGGLLAKADPKHKQESPDQHACQITITNNSTVEEVKNGGIKPSETEFNFIPLRYIPELKPMASRIDIVAIVWGISPKENRKRKRDQLDISFRNIILIDYSHSLQTTALTTWGKFIHNECETLAKMLPKHPIIVATNLQLKDGEEGNRYVSTTQFSEIFINLEIPEVKRLEAWKLENENVLKNISSKSGSFTTLRMRTIQDILDTADMGATYHLKASVKTILQQEQCWYSACSSCHKKTPQQTGTTFTCDSCDEPSATAELMPYVRVELGDSTGNLPTTLFGTNAEKVLSCEANQFITRDLEEQLNLLEKWMNERTDIDYIFRVKLAKRRDSMSLNTIKVQIW